MRWKHPWRILPLRAIDESRCDDDCEPCVPADPDVEASWERAKDVERRADELDERMKLLEFEIAIQARQARRERSD